MKKLRLGILISGRGSNLNALIGACQRNNFPAGIAIVISNKSDAEGLENAKKARIKTKVIQHKDYPDRETFDREIHNCLMSENVDLICLAGFMRLLSKWFVEKWPNKIINIHPSLLPSFKGLNATSQAIKSGVKVSGCTVHFVNEKLDGGKIILKKFFYIDKRDNVSSLRKKTQKLEYIAFSEAVIKLVNQSIY